MSHRAHAANVGVVHAGVRLYVGFGNQEERVHPVVFKIHVGKYHVRDGHVERRLVAARYEATAVADVHDGIHADPGLAAGPEEREVRPERLAGFRVQCVYGRVVSELAVEVGERLDVHAPANQLVAMLYGTRTRLEQGGGELRSTVEPPENLAPAVVVPYVVPRRCGRVGRVGREGLVQAAAVGVLPVPAQSPEPSPGRGQLVSFDLLSGKLAVLARCGRIGTLRGQRLACPFHVHSAQCRLVALESAAINSPGGVGRIVTVYAAVSRQCVRWRVCGGLYSWQGGVYIYVCACLR